MQGFVLVVLGQGVLALIDTHSTMSIMHACKLYAHRSPVASSSGFCPATWSKQR
jgi:hypothetical protein